MGDFVQKSVTKSASRVLATPIPSLAAFEGIVDDILADNPFGCTPYEYGGQAMPAVEKTREAYTARIIYEDGEAATVGQVTVKCPTSAAYTANTATVLANTAIATAMGGTAVHETDNDTFSAVVKCHAANGELFTVTVGRETVSVSSYADDAILAAVEAWADTVPALA